MTRLRISIYIYVCLFVLWKDDSKIPTKKENKFSKTFEKMEGFSFATPVTGPNRPNTRKEDDICTLTTHF
jgi:hypothetical protein